MKLKKIFGTRKDAAAFADADAAECRRLMLLGAKLDIAGRVMACGTEHFTYRGGVISFPMVGIRTVRGYADFVCDAVGVRLPASPSALPEALEEGGMMTYGLFVHAGAADGSMTWNHIDNLSDGDVVRLGRAVRDACAPGARRAC